MAPGLFTTGSHLLTCLHPGTTTAKVQWPLPQGLDGGVLGVTAVLLPAGRLSSEPKSKGRVEHDSGTDPSRTTGGGIGGRVHQVDLALSHTRALTLLLSLRLVEGTPSRTPTLNWQALTDQLRAARKWPDLMVWSPLVAVQPVWAPSSPNPEATSSLGTGGPQAPSSETQRRPLARGIRCPHPGGYAVVVVERGIVANLKGSDPGAQPLPPSLRAHLHLQVFGDIARTLHAALLELELDAILVHCVDIASGCASADAVGGRQVCVCPWLRSAHGGHCQILPLQQTAFKLSQPQWR